MVTGNGTDKNKDSAPIIHSPTPPTQRRLAKSFSVTPSSANKGSVRYFLFNFGSLMCSLFEFALFSYNKCHHIKKDNNCFL